MKLTVNGEERECPEGSTLRDLMTSLGLRPDLLVAEVNRTIVDRSKVASWTLREGDQVELIQFVGGG